MVFWTLQLISFSPPWYRSSANLSDRTPQLPRQLVCPQRGPTMLLPQPTSFEPEKPSGTGSMSSILQLSDLGWEAEAEATQ